jgi:N-acyl-L-homoserine lactone synthetase
VAEERLVVDGSIEAIDELARLLVGRARPVTYRLAATGAEVEVAQRLRAQAVLARGWRRPDDLPDGREADADDARAEHILAVLDPDVIGTCRLIYPEPGVPLPMEMPARSTPVPRRAVEVGRITVASRTGGRDRKILAGLVAAAWLQLRSRGERRICGSASASMLRLLRAIGFAVEVIGPAVVTFGEERYPMLIEASPATLAALAARYGSGAGGPRSPDSNSTAEPTGVNRPRRSGKETQGAMPQNPAEGTAHARTHLPRHSPS